MLMDGLRNQLLKGTPFSLRKSLPGLSEDGRIGCDAAAVYMVNYNRAKLSTIRHPSFSHGRAFISISQHHIDKAFQNDADTTAIMKPELLVSLMTIDPFRS